MSHLTVTSAPGGIHLHMCCHGNQRGGGGGGEREREKRERERKGGMCQFQYHIYVCSSYQSYIHQIIIQLEHGLCNGARGHARYYRKVNFTTTGHRLYGSQTSSAATEQHKESQLIGRDHLIQLLIEGGEGNKAPNH